MNHKLLNGILFIVILLLMAVIGVLGNQAHENNEIIELQSKLIDVQRLTIDIKNQIIEAQKQLIILHTDPIYIIERTHTIRDDLIKVGDFVKPTKEALRLINGEESTTRALQKSNFNEVLSIDGDGVATIRVLNSDETQIINVYWLQSAGFIVIKPESYEHGVWIS